MSKIELEPLPVARWAWGEGRAPRFDQGAYDEYQMRSERERCYALGVKAGLEMAAKEAMKMAALTWKASEETCYTLDTRRHYELEALMLQQLADVILDLDK